LHAEFKKQNEKSSYHYTAFDELVYFSGVHEAGIFRRTTFSFGTIYCYAQYFKDSKDILSLKFRLLDK